MGIIYLKKNKKVLNPHPICQVITFAIIFWKGTDFFLCLKGYQQQRFTEVFCRTSNVQCIL